MASNHHPAGERANAGAIISRGLTRRFGETLAVAPLDGEMRRTFWCESEEARSRLTFATERCIVDRAKRAIVCLSAG